MKPFVELPICPECRVPVELTEGCDPFCHGCQISWDVGKENPLPTEPYFEGDDRRKAQ